MIFTLTVISLLLLVLYVKELRKNHKMENDYNYINSRLLDIVNHEESNYTAENINFLLEKFYDRQIDYRRGQKTILQIFHMISEHRSPF